MLAIGYVNKKPYPAHSDENSTAKKEHFRDQPVLKISSYRE